MDNFAETLNTAFTQILLYFNYFKDIFRYPKSFYRRNNITQLNGCVFLVISILIMTFLEYPMFVITSAMVEIDGVWDVLLETKEEREFYTAPGFLVGSKEFLDQILSITFWVVSFYLVIRLFYTNFTKKKKFSSIFWNIIVLVSVYNVSQSILNFIAFSASNNELVSNRLYLFILLLFFLASSFLLVYFILVIQSYLRTSYFKSIGLIISSSVIYLLIFSLINLIDWYNSYSKLSSAKSIESALDYNYLAANAFENNLYDEAISHSLNALEVSPENLRSDCIILLSKIEKFKSEYDYSDLYSEDTKSATIYETKIDSFHYEDNELDFDRDNFKEVGKDVFNFFYRDTSKVVEADFLLKKLYSVDSTIKKFSSKYSHLPSAQLFAADMYESFNMCDQVRKLSIDVFNHPLANPSEKVAAASAIKGITSNDIIGEKYEDYLSNTNWISDSDSSFDKIGLFIRVFTSRSSDNLNLLFNGYDFDEINQILTPQERTSSIFRFIEVLYSCNNEFNLEIKIKGLQGLNKS